MQWIGNGKYWIPRYPKTDILFVNVTVQADMCFIGEICDIQNNPTIRSLHHSFNNCKYFKTVFRVSNQIVKLVCNKKLKCCVTEVQIVYGGLVCLRLIQFIKSTVYLMECDSVWSGNILPMFKWNAGEFLPKYTESRPRLWYSP
jgi:hypothetical protein